MQCLKPQSASVLLYNHFLIEWYFYIFIETSIIWNTARTEVIIFIFKLYLSLETIYRLRHTSKEKNWLLIIAVTNLDDKLRRSGSTEPEFGNQNLSLVHDLKMYQFFSFSKESRRCKKYRISIARQK